MKLMYKKLPSLLRIQREAKLQYILLHQQMTQLSSTFSYVKLLAILALAGYSTSAPTQSFAHDAQLVKRVDSGFSKDDAGGLQHDEQYNTVYVGSDWGVCSPLTKNGFDGLNLNTKTAITNAFSTVFNDFDFNAYSGKNIHFSTNGGDGTYSGIGLTLETANAHNAGNNFAYGDPVTQQLYGYNEWKDDGNFPPNVFKTLSCQSSAKNAAVMSSGNPDVKVTQQQVFGDSNVPGSITFSIQEGTSETTTWSYSSTSEQSLGVSNTLSYDVTIGNDASPVKESIGDSLTISYSQDSSTTTNNGHSNTMSSVRATTLGPYCQPSGSTCTALFNQTSFTSGGSITLHNSVHGYVWYEVACHDACDYMYDIVHQNLELLNPQGLPSCFKFYLWNNKGADQGEGSADGKGSQAGILLARGDIQCYADKGLFDPSTLLSTTTLQISTNGQSTATTGYHIVCDGGDISSCGGSALTNITIVNSGGSSSGTSGNSGTSAGGGSTPASGSSSGSSSASSGPSSGSTSGSSSGSSGSTSGPSTNSVLQCPQQLKTLTNSCNITLPDFTSLVSRQNSDTAGTIFQVEQAGTSGSLGTNLIHFTAASGTRSCQAVYQVTPPWSSYFLPEENTLVAPYDGSNMISSYTFGYEASCPQQYGSCYLESVVSANNPHMTWQPLTDASKSNIKLTFGNAGQAWQSDIFTFTLSCADGYGNIGHSQIQQYVQLQPVVGVTQAGATATVTQHTISVAQFTSIATYYQDVIVPSVVVAKYTTTYYSSTSYTDTTYLTVASALASTKTSAQTTTVTDPGSTIKATVQGSPVTRTVTCTITPAAATITATLTRGSTSTSTVFMAGPTQTVTQQCAKKAPTKHCILGYCWYMKRALRLDGQITARALPTLTKTTVAPSITTTVTDTSDTATFTQSGVTVTSIDLVSRFTAAYTTTVTNTVQTATYVGVLSTQATIIVKSYAVTATSTVLAHVAGSIVQTTITVAPVTTVKTVSSTGLNLTPITKTTTVAPAVIVITKTSPPTTITTCA